MPIIGSPLAMAASSFLSRLVVLTPLPCSPACTGGPPSRSRTARTARVDPQCSGVDITAASASKPRPVVHHVLARRASAADNLPGQPGPVTGDPQRSGREYGAGAAGSSRQGVAVLQFVSITGQSRVGNLHDAACRVVGQNHHTEHR